MYSAPHIYKNRGNMCLCVWIKYEHKHKKKKKKKEKCQPLIEFLKSAKFKVVI